MSSLTLRDWCQVRFNRRRFTDPSLFERLSAEQKKYLKHKEKCMNCPDFHHKACVWIAIRTIHRASDVSGSMLYLTGIIGSICDDRLFDYAIDNVRLLSVFINLHFYSKIVVPAANTGHLMFIKHVVEVLDIPIHMKPTNNFAIEKMIDIHKYTDIIEYLIFENTLGINVPRIYNSLWYYALKNSNNKCIRYLIDRYQTVYNFDITTCNRRDAVWYANEQTLEFINTTEKPISIDDIRLYAKTRTTKNLELIMKHTRKNDWLIYMRGSIADVIEKRKNKLIIAFNDCFGIETFEDIISIFSKIRHDKTLISLLMKSSNVTPGLIILNYIATHKIADLGDMMFYDQNALNFIIYYVQKACNIELEKIQKPVPDNIISILKGYCYNYRNMETVIEAVLEFDAKLINSQVFRYIIQLYMKRKIKISAVVDLLHKNRPLPKDALSLLITDDKCKEVGLFSKFLRNGAVLRKKLLKKIMNDDYYSYFILLDAAGYLSTKKNIKIINDMYDKIPYTHRIYSYLEYNMH